jgi:hypothetical protein
MKSSVSKSQLVKVFRVSAIFGLLLFSTLLTVNAQTTNFAQFVEVNGTKDFVFTNNGGSGDFNAIPGGSPIIFFYQNLPTLPASLLGPQFAHMFVTTTTTQPGFGVGAVTQPLNQTVTVNIVRDTPAPVGTGGGSRTNLLTAVFSPNATQPAIVGSGGSATLSASTPDHNVTFTSNFLIFTATTERNLGLSFSAVTPNMALGLGSFLQNTTAAGSGTFASNPLPIPPGPTAAAVTVSGRVSTANGRGLRNAEVTLLDSNGTVMTARTTNFGHFSFEGIASGQSVIISVRSKRYTFAPQVISLQDSATDINFVANQ